MYRRAQGIRLRGPHASWTAPKETSALPLETEMWVFCPFVCNRVLLQSRDGD
jgi:hypothetical protein